MHVDGIPYRTVWLEGATVRMINQHLLPHRFEVIDLPTYDDTATAIRTMIVRRAGAIGAAAGYGLAQAALAPADARFAAALARAAEVLRATRPPRWTSFTPSTAC